MAERGNIFQTPRDWFLILMSGLFSLLAISDLTKWRQFQNHPERLGMVIFGHRIESVFGNFLVGVPFGIFLAMYVFGIVTRKRWMLVVSAVYAFYVPVNEVMFWSLHVHTETPPVGFIVMYLTLSLGGSIGTAIYLAHHRESLN